MPGVIPSTLAADRAVVEAWVMAGPAGDVAAALLTIGGAISLIGIPEERSAVREALYVLAQAVQAGRERARVIEECAEIISAQAMEREQMAIRYEDAQGPGFTKEQEAAMRWAWDTCKAKREARDALRALLTPGEER